ncbi:MAG: creatininase family protein [Clostridiales bacterium]|nr:creatininase family protein [Clostridiales bacterium]
MRWEWLHQEDFDKAIEISKGVCVMPMGCCEMHGEHLPVGQDYLTAEYVAREASKLEPVCLFPTFRFGDVQGLRMWKGSVILSVELEQALLTELCSEIARNGFKKIILLNGHGGNIPLLGNFVRSTMKEKKDYVVVARNEYCWGVSELVQELDAGADFPLLTKEDKEYVRDFVYNKKTWGHAGIEETSVMCKIAPELVNFDRMHVRDGLSRHKSDYLAEVGFGLTTRFWLKDYPDSYAGHHPEKANARIGETILRRRIETQAEACRRLKQDDRVLEWNDEYNKMW